MGAAPEPPTNLPTPTEALREKIEQAIGPIVQSGQQRVQLVERVTRIMAAEVFHGPIPHPKHIQAYEDACPGAADRIIRMAEIAQQRREDRRDRIVEHEYSDRRLGLKLGFAALLALVIAGVVVIAIGNVVVGSTLLGAAVLGTVVGTFVNGRLQPANKIAKQETETQNPSAKA